MKNEFLSGFKEGFQSFGHGVAGIVNVVLLAIVYFLGIGVVSVIGKIVRKEFLQLKLDTERESYWEVYEGHEDYERMF